MIAPLLAMMLAPAPVYVEAASAQDSAQTTSLRDQLMVRLLEEGYPLAPSAEHATRTLRVEATDEGIRVEAEGSDLRSFEVASGPVLPLEAVHRAMEALDEVTPRARPTTAPPPRYAVHVQSAPPTTSRETLQRVLVRSVLDGRRAVVPVDANPDGVLCAQRQGDDAVELSRGQDVGSCGPPTRVVATPGVEPSPQLDDSVDDLIDVPAKHSAEGPTPAPTPTTVTDAGLSAERAPRRRRPAVRVGARTGIYGRIIDADAAVGTTLRVGPEPGPAGLLDLLLVPTSARDISIFETSVGAGFGWMWAVTDNVGIHLQGITGLQIHRYRQRGAEAGHRFDWTAEVPLSTSLRLTRDLRLELALRGGVTGRARQHRVDDVVVWSRTAWRVGASVGLSYGWRPRAR